MLRKQLIRFVQLGTRTVTQKAQPRLSHPLSTQISLTRLASSTPSSLSTQPVRYLSMLSKQTYKEREHALNQLYKTKAGERLHAHDSNFIDICLYANKDDFFKTLEEIEAVESFLASAAVSHLIHVGLLDPSDLMWKFRKAKETRKMVEALAIVSAYVSQMSLIYRHGNTQRLLKDGVIRPEFLPFIKRFDEDDNAIMTHINALAGIYTLPEIQDLIKNKFIEPAALWNVFNEDNRYDANKTWNKMVKLKDLCATSAVKTLIELQVLQPEQMAFVFSAVYNYDLMKAHSGLVTLSSLVQSTLATDLIKKRRVTPVQLADSYFTCNTNPSKTLMAMLHNLAGNKLAESALFTKNLEMRVEPETLYGMRRGPGRKS